MITCGNFQYELDAEESVLRARITPSYSYVDWELKAKALDRPEYEEIDEASNAPSAYLFFTVEGICEWRQLAGVGTAMRPKAGKDIVLLPDDPAGFYPGYHQLSQNHRIKIGKRSKNILSVAPIVSVDVDVIESRPLVTRFGLNLFSSFVINRRLPLSNLPTR